MPSNGIKVLDTSALSSSSQSTQNAYAFSGTPLEALGSLTENKKDI
jgi:hypothetical protein